MTERTDQLPLVLNERGAWVAERTEQRGEVIALRRKVGLGDGVTWGDPAGSFDLLVSAAAETGFCVSAPLLDIMAEGKETGEEAEPPDFSGIKAVCSFCVDDVTTVHPDMTDAEAAAYLEENHKYIQDAMCQAGYVAIRCLR